jgi:hypothetical protein
MKKIILYLLSLCFTFCALSSAAQSDDDDFFNEEFKAMDMVSYHLGHQFARAVRKAKLPAGTKIYVLPFYGRRATHDTAKTPLGVRISADMTYWVKKKAQSRRMRNFNLQIISNDDNTRQLDELMRGFFTPPATQKEESELWNMIENNQRPDYYLVGKYEVDNDYKTLRVFDVKLIRDRFSPPPPKVPREVVIGRSESPIKLETERENFRKWDVEIKRLPDAFVDLVNYRSKGMFANAVIKQDGLNTIISPDSLLTVGRNYFVEVDLAEDAHVYIFYYESGDFTGNEMYMVYPFDQSQGTFFKRGRHRFPDPESNFALSMPGTNKVFLKVVASKRELPLQISQSRDGYIVLQKERSMVFVNGLEKMNENEVSTVNIIREVGRR